MTRFARVALGLLTVAGTAGCSTGTAPKPAAVGAPGKSVTIGMTRLDPDNLTMSRDETLSFVSTSTDALTVEFIQPAPAEQAARIKCAVADPKSLKAGETAWATFRTNSQGHLTADVPAGQFPSTCKLAPGSYTYVVRPLNPAIRPSENFLGQQGTITVK